MDCKNISVLFYFLRPPTTADRSWLTKKSSKHEQILMLLGLDSRVGRRPQKITLPPIASDVFRCLNFATWVKLQEKINIYQDYSISGKVDYCAPTLRPARLAGCTNLVKSNDSPPSKQGEYIVEHKFAHESQLGCKKPRSDLSVRRRPASAKVLSQQSRSMRDWFCTALSRRLHH